MMTGFGNQFASEAVAGALPIGRNSPQRPAFGLYTEQISGSSFTAPRQENRRTWMYRMRPSAAHPAFVPYSGAPLLQSGPFHHPPNPNRLRWDPIGLPKQKTDRSEEHTSELQSLMRISYAVFCLKKK